MKLEDYYYHTISKDDVDKTYYILEKILKEGRLKSQELLGENEKKFNGINYISLASYNKNREYKSFIIDEDSFKESQLANIFDDYNSYLTYMKLNEWLEEPISKEKFFIKNSTNDKREYYNYLDSIFRKYPVDIRDLYEKSNDEIYRLLLDLIDGDVIYCDKSEDCFEKYIRESKGITFVFPKNIEVEKVTIIPNLPFDIEDKIVTIIGDANNRYSNQIGEVQVRDSLDINKAIGVIVAEEMDLSRINNMLEDKNYNLKIFKLVDEYLVDIKI